MLLLSELWRLAAFRSDSDPAFAALLGFVFGIVLFVKGFRDFQLKRLIENTPTAKVRSAAIGLVELQGTAVGPYTVRSPIQNLDCFYYRTVLSKWERRGKNSEWRTVADERRHVLFYLKDATGMLLVNPDGADIDMHCDYKEEFKNGLFSGADPGMNTVAFMERYGVSRGSQVKIEEYTICPEAPIFVLGTLATNLGLRPSPMPTSGSGLLGGGMDSKLMFALNNPGGMLGEAITQAVVTRVSKIPPDALAAALAKAEAHAETIKPGDPRAASAVAAISAHDPELAQKLASHLGVAYPPPAAAAAGMQPVDTNIHVNVRVNGVPVQGLDPSNPKIAMVLGAIGAKNPALAEVIASHFGIVPKTETDPAAPAPGAWPDHDPTILQKGRHDKHFYISWRSQKEVLSSLAWHSSLSIFGGPILTLVCVWYLLGRMGIH